MPSALTEEENVVGAAQSEIHQYLGNNFDFKPSTIIGLASLKISFDVLPVWKGDFEKAPNSNFYALMQSQVMADQGMDLAALVEVGNRGSVGDDIPDNAESVVDKLIVRPHARARICWDSAGLLFVLYDIITLPFFLTFQPAETFFQTFMIWLTRIFWTIDIPNTFFTGFMTPEGAVIMHARLIMRRYLTTWFLADLMIVLIDWCELIMAQDDTSVNLFQASGSARGIRLVRILRLVRLLRMIRMKYVLENFFERSRYNSEKIGMGAGVLRHILGLLGMCHFIACLWYYIGNVTPEGWVDTEGFSPLEASADYQYTTSLHWSLCQLTGGMDEIHPHTTGERCFNIIVFLLGFIMAGIFISSLTSTSTHLELIASRQSKQMSALRRYLRQKGISQHLTARLCRNAYFTFHEQGRFLTEEQVEVLANLSEELRVELHFEMYAPTLAVHRFFACYIDEMPLIMRRVCHHALSTSKVCRHDHVFNVGEIDRKPRMHIVIEGTLSFTSVQNKVFAVTLWRVIAEGTLWTAWTHRGTLVAEMECLLVTLDAKEFHDIVKQFEHPGFDPKGYAMAFVQDLNTFENEITDVTIFEDLEVEGLESAVRNCDWFRRQSVRGRREGRRANGRQKFSDSLPSGLHKSMREKMNSMRSRSTVDRDSTKERGSRVASKVSAFSFTPSMSVSRSSSNNPPPPTIVQPMHP
jgi:hypothetical protein